MLIVEELEGLKRLLDQGVLSEEEFAQQKERLLSGVNSESEPVSLKIPLKAHDAGVGVVDNESDVSVWMTKALTLCEIGNSHSATLELDKILEIEPDHFDALDLRAKCSRVMYPAFAGSNGEFLNSRLVSRVKPVIGHYLIAEKFCPEDRKAAYSAEAGKELLEYALQVMAEGAARMASTAMDAIGEQTGGVLQRVFEKSQVVWDVSKNDLIEVVEIAERWGAMNSDMAELVGSGFKKDKKKPAFKAFYDQLNANYPGANLPPQGCFPADAQVTMPGRKTVSIDSLSVGDLVLTVNAGGDEQYRPVTKVLVHSAQVIEALYFKDGSILRVTANHRAKTEMGWLKIDEINPGMAILSPKGDRKVVIGKEKQGREPVFNLYTADNHNFVVADCVVHNFNHFRVLRTVIHRLFLDPLHLGFLKPRQELIDN